VAVVRLATDGRIAGWGEEAAALFGWSGDDVEGRLWQELAVWADGTGPVPLEELLRLARWQGTYAVRTASGGVLPVFASHVADRLG
jgi:PAS domain-containing protein